MSKKIISSVKVKENVGGISEKLNITPTRSFESQDSSDLYGRTVEDRMKEAEDFFHDDEY